MSETAAHSPDGHAPDRTRSHRGDVDGLRAVAIVLVVAFHAKVPGFPGGFIGVDVFFVISGYLITRNLLRETTETGTVGFLAFWGKRIRRLVPAMFLMLIVVFGLAVLVISALDLSAVAQEGRAAALYVSNIFYAREATDYFGDINQSLFLHTWSLGVEEQFYLVWPALFGAACLAARRNRLWLRRILVGGFSVTFVASLTLCVVLTQRGSPWAFFSLPTRAWEFAAAGLLAAWTIPQGLRHRHLQLVAAAIGLVLIGIADLTLSATTPYPGLYALLPVGGTILLIVAGEATVTARTNPISSTLAVSPAQWLGRVSYSWYLWHWPLILLAVAWLDSDSRRVTVAAALVSLAVATVAHHFFENPIRFNTRLTHSKPKTYTLAATFTAIVLLASVGVTKYGDHKIQNIEIAFDDGTPTKDRTGPIDVGERVGARTGADELLDLRKARRNFDCPRERRSENGIDYCEAGQADSATTVFLMGDSHTRHWVPAFIQAADQLGLRLVVRWRASCPSNNVPVVGLGRAGAADPGCTDFENDTDDLLDELDPEMVVLSNSTGYRVIGGDAAWPDGLRDRLSGLREAHRSVGVVTDTPRFANDPVECLVAGGSVDSCAISRADAFDGGRLEREKAEREVIDSIGDIPRLDVNDILCPDDICVVWLNGLFVYTDTTHMYDRFVVGFTPQVVQFLSEMTKNVDAS